MSKHLLSKSTFLKGLQCEKQLYLYKYHPELQDKTSIIQQAIFDRGHDVGALAQKLFPGGIDASPESFRDFSESISLTAELIQSKTDVIYEAAFLFDDVLIAADIVVRDGDKWKVYEVKSSTSVSDINVLDAAIQYYVMSNSGLEISDYFIVTINNKYVRKGDINLQNLFKKDSVFKKILKIQQSIISDLQRLKGVISKREVPRVEIGAYCTSPYTCSFYSYCWKHLPPDSVFDISGMHLRKKFELYNEGIAGISEIPKDLKLSAGQRMQVDSFQNGETIIDHKSIKGFLNTLHYPLHFLDFESFQPAVPLFDNSNPYQQITFQYSLHYKESPQAELKHYEYLAEINGDPRPGFIKQLLNDLGKKGDIVVYNKSYEIGRINELARDFPKYAADLKALILRVKDLMLPFQKKYYYAPEMKGSFSIKFVLPALVPEMDYENMEIANGVAASIGFENLQNETDMFRIKEIRSQLLEYCKLDTLAMVKILEKLEAITLAEEHKSSGV